MPTDAKLAAMSEADFSSFLDTSGRVGRQRGLERFHRPLSFSRAPRRASRKLHARLPAEVAGGSTCVWAVGAGAPTKETIMEALVGTKTEDSCGFPRRDR